MPPPGQRLPTGIPALDKCLRGGFAPGRIYTTIGAPHRGKTALNSQLALHVALHSGAAVVGLFYDEGSWQAGLMMAEGLGHERADLEDAYAEHQAAVAESFKNLNLWAPNPATDDSELEKVEQGLIAKGLGNSLVVLVVDSIQRTRCHAASNATTSKDKADAVMQTLRAMIGRHPNWIVLLAAKANRGSWANKNPAMNFDPMSAGLDSSSIEYDSDFIAFLDGKIDTGISYIVLKNRPGTGDTPTIKLLFSRPRATFSEVDSIVDDQQAAETATVKDQKKAMAHEKRVADKGEAIMKTLSRLGPTSTRGIVREVGGKHEDVLKILQGLEGQRRIESETRIARGGPAVFWKKSEVIS